MRRRPIACLLVTVTLIGAAPVFRGASAAPPNDLRARTAALPALSVATTVRIPLAQTAPGRWRPIGDVRLSTGEETRSGAASTLAVDYERPVRAAAGIAFPLPPSALAELDALHLTMSGSPAQRLRVCLTDGDGRVYAFPTVEIGANAAPFRLNASALAFDPFQNRGRSEAPPVLEDMVLITILDINGFMSDDTPACSWTLLDAYGVRR